MVRRTTGVGETVRRSAVRGVGTASRTAPRAKTGSRVEGHSVASEMEGGRGLGLATKFSLLIVGTLVVAVAAVASVVSRQCLALVEEQIDLRGAALLGELLHQPSAFWASERAQATQNVSAFLKGLAEDPAQRGQILCLLVEDAEGHLEVASAPGDAFKMDAPSRERQIGEVRITDRACTGGGFQGIAAREFRAERADRSGAIRLVLRADRIEQVRKRLTNTTVLAVVLSFLLGSGVAVGLSQLVTRPIQVLVHDMQVVSQGRLDHRTTSHSRDEIGLLARAFNRMTHDLRAAHVAEVEQRSVERDLELGRDIQASLLPQRVPQLPGMELAPFYRSAKVVGGDYYDFIALDSEHLGIAVADVSGKGVQGSMVMAMARSVLRSYATGSRSTKDTLALANATIARDLRPGSFVTVLYLILQVAKKELLVSSAGHNPLAFVRAGKVHKINPSGIAVGFDKGPLFNSTIAETRVALQGGDVVVAYTDGVVEAMNAKQEEYGNERFFRYCSANAGRPAAAFVEGLVKELDAHKGNAPQHDDITIVALRVL
ncbi:MAG: SpoIIE family protein phosphatase [Planctomycetes bacterium]|nr:SpoIIE family protein phosphatase [Planctomycetota bacterium]